MKNFSIELAQRIVKNSPLGECLAEVEQKAVLDDYNIKYSCSNHLAHLHDSIFTFYKIIGDTQYESFLIKLNQYRKNIIEDDRIAKKFQTINNLTTRNKKPRETPDGFLRIEVVPELFLEQIYYQNSKNSNYCYLNKLDGSVINNVVHNLGILLGYTLDKIEDEVFNYLISAMVKNHVYSIITVDENYKAPSKESTVTINRMVKPHGNSITLFIPVIQGNKNNYTLLRTPIKHNKQACSASMLYAMGVEMEFQHTKENFRVKYVLTDEESNLLSENQNHDKKDDEIPSLAQMLVDSYYKK